MLKRTSFPRYNVNVALKAHSSFKLYCSRNHFLKLRLCYSDGLSITTKSSIVNFIFNIDGIRYNFFCSISNISNIYYQTVKKTSAVCIKLIDKTRSSRVLTEKYKSMCYGLDKLVYIESVMRVFFECFIVYEGFLKTVACCSDRYSSYPDVLSCYISLNYGYDTLIKEYYYMLLNLHKFSFLSMVVFTRLFSQMYNSLRLFEFYEIKVKNIGFKYQRILEKSLRLKLAGFDKSLKIIKSQYCLESILQDSVGLNYIKFDNQTINIQLNNVRNEIVVLRQLIDLIDTI